MTQDKDVTGGASPLPVCDQCGKIGSAHAVFCGGCGHPLPRPSDTPDAMADDVASETAETDVETVLPPPDAPQAVGRRVSLEKPPVGNAPAGEPAPPKSADPALGVNPNERQEATESGATWPQPELAVVAHPRRPIWQLAAMAFGLVLLSLFAILAAVWFLWPTDDQASERPVQSPPVEVSVTDTPAPAPGPLQPLDKDGGGVGQELTKFVVASATIRDRASVDADSVAVDDLPVGQQVRGTMVRALDGTGFWFRLSDGRGYVQADQLSDGPPLPASPPMAPTEPVIIIQPTPSAPAPQQAPPIATRTPATPPRVNRPSAGSAAGTIGRGPTFACARATTYVEQMICSDPQLAALERRMVALYGQVRSNREHRQQVLIDQRLFLSALTQCQDRLCIQQMYQDRISELAGY